MSLARPMQPLPPHEVPAPLVKAGAGGRTANPVRVCSGLSIVRIATSGGQRMLASVGKPVGVARDARQSRPGCS